MSIFAEVAKGVEAKLESTTFSMPVVIDRVYDATRKAESIVDPLLTVLPGGFTVEQFTRTQDKFVCKIDVGVRARGKAANVNEIDKFNTLVEEVIEAFKWQRLSVINATCVAVEVAPISEAGDHQTVLCAVVTFDFEVIR